MQSRQQYSAGACFHLSQNLRYVCDGFAGTKHRLVQAGARVPGKVQHHVFVQSHLITSS
jgi:hypothetical protein